MSLGQVGGRWIVRVTILGSGHLRLRQRYTNQAGDEAMLWEQTALCPGPHSSALYMDTACHPGDLQSLHLSRDAVGHPCECCIDTEAINFSALKPGEYHIQRPGSLLFSHWVTKCPLFSYYRKEAFGIRS